MENTKLLIEGVAPEEITVSFLTSVMDACENQGLPLEGISILHEKSEK